MEGQTHAADAGRFWLVALVFSVGLFPVGAQGQVVTTLAGSGAPGSADGTGAAASFSYPAGVAVDGAGNLYVADADNNKIRKMTSGGIVTTFAGSGSAGSQDATGAAATFNSPYGVAVDSSGNVYVGDTGNNEIRKITPGGVVTTLAGSGGAGSQDGTGAAASFDGPAGLAVDGGGNIYVAEAFGNKIRKVTSAGVVTTLAGSGASGGGDGTGIAASFNAPAGVAVDAGGNVFVADALNNKIRKVTQAGVVTTLAGSGSQGIAEGAGTSASFNWPSGICLDAAGNAFVADTGNSKIRKVTAVGIVTTFAGSGQPGSTDGTGTAASFGSPFGLAVDASGKLYVTDVAKNNVRKISRADRSVKPGPPATPVPHRQ